MSNNYFEQKIKPILLYVGTIGAILMSIGYIILMFVLVLGFKATTDLTQSLVFAGVNAIVGFIIMQFLKVQGVDFAKNIDSNEETIKEYNKVVCKQLDKKKKKMHTMTHFWTKTVITDLLTKIITVAITTAGIIYIVVEGSNDYNMLLLSVVNLLLFACFGLLSLVKAYDFYNNQYIPYVKEAIKKYNEDEEERQKAKENIKRCVEMVTSELNNMEDDTICSSGRVDILDTSVDTISDLPDKQ